MKTFEHNPFGDTYIPYIVEPEIGRYNQFKFLLETAVAFAKIPMAAKFVIYQVLKNL